MNDLILLVMVFTVALSGGAMAEERAKQPTEVDFAVIDQAVESFMAEHEIRAGTLAVSVDGEVVHTAGFGFRDAERSIPVTADTLMRIASICKPITAAVVRQLVAEGELTLETRLCDVLELTPPDGHEGDPRLRAITIAHLLDHKGGWDRSESGDPMFRDAAVQQFLEIDRAPTADDIITFMLAQPLDFDPGSKSAYSNFGYCLLGRAVEKITGKAFHEVVRERIGEPLEMSSLALGRTFAEDRPEHEVHYPISDGSLHIERMDAHGGLIANAPDLCRFAAHYWISGEPRNAEPRSYAFYGAMPGTLALLRQRPDGIDYAVLFNRWPREKYQQLMPHMDEAVDAAFEE